MKKLKLFAGFAKVQKEGPVVLVKHSQTGKYAVVVVKHDGSLEHRDKPLKALKQLNTSKRLVSEATAKRDFEAARKKYGLVNA